MTDASKKVIDLNELDDLIQTEHEIINKNLYDFITKEEPTIVIQIASLTALASNAAMVSRSLDETYLSGPMTFSEYFIVEFLNQLKAYRNAAAAR